MSDHQDYESGEIHHHKRFRQEYDLEGMTFERGIRPTDIDLVIDFGGRTFVLIELKVKGATFRDGQRKAIERILKAHVKSGTPALGIVATHDSDPSELLDVANCVVSKAWYDGNWKEMGRERKVREYINDWREWVGDLD